MSDFGAAAAPPERTREAARFWWIYLLLGAGWLFFAIIIFRFDWTSVSSISILFGAALLAFGAAEFFAAVGASTGWKIAHGLIGLACIVIGMVAFIVDIPNGVTDAATALPVQVFLWSDSPERGFVEKTSGAIIVLLAFLVVMNTAAVILRKRFERRW